MLKKIILIFVLFFIGINGSFAANQPILVFSAMQPEYQAFAKCLQDKKQYNYEGIEITQGQIGENTIIASYSGVGAVNAGIAATLLIKKFHPSTLIVTGVAGGLQNDLNVGDVVIGTEVYSLNFGKMTAKGPIFPIIKVPPNPFKKISDPLIYKTSPKLQQIIKSMPTKIHLVFGSIATDQHFPDNSENDTLAKEYGSKIIDMEDVAFAHTCWLFNVPNFIAIRGISDIIGTNDQYSDKTVNIASHNAGLITYKLIEEMQ